jgi:hypothetical protein
MILNRSWKYRLLPLLILMWSGLPCTRVMAQSSQSVEPPDWFAGDAHVHRGIGCSRSNEKEMLSPPELLEMMKPNDLAVVAVLADAGNGEMKYAEKDIPLITGADNPASTPGRILHWDAEWHFDPRGVTFEQKMIGGHLIILGLQHGKSFFSEYTYPVFKWARDQGAAVGFAHLQYLPEGIPKALDCCAPLEMPVETALGNVSFLMEDVHGSETAIQAYYRILNCGFRPGLAAGTDYSCNFLEPLGTLLTYVRVPDGRLTYAKWVEGLVHGRTVVSRDGHQEFLDLKVDKTFSPGEAILLKSKGRVHAGVRWTSLRNSEGRIEIVRNGRIIVSRAGTASPGSPLTFETTVDFDQSGWLCARRMDGNGHRTHTGAVFVIVGKAPIRASVSDAEFFVQWIDNLIQQTSPGGAWSDFFPKDREAAQNRYRKARAVFEKIASEARAQDQATKMEGKALVH